MTEIAEQCRELATLITRHTKTDGFHSTAINRLEFARESTAATLLPGVVQPMLAIIVQGKKAALLGDEAYYYGAAQYLVISVDLPISGFIVEASATQPYLGFKLNLDPLQLCDIITTDPNLRVDNKETCWEIKSASGQGFPILCRFYAASR